MPQRTIASGGGLWNSTSTWVEGAVPTTSDFVVGNASSGNLTVNVGTNNIQYFDFTNYSGNITFTSSTSRINFAATTSTTTVFGSGTTYTYTTGFNINNGFGKSGTGTGSIRQFGTTNIGVFSYNVSGLNNLLSDLYVNEIYFAGSGSYGFNGSFTVFVDGKINSSSSSNGNSTIKLIGTGATTLDMALGFQPIVIDTSGGTTTITTVFGGTNLTHLSGNIVNAQLTPLNTASNPITTYDLISGTSWSLNVNSNLNFLRTINIIKPTNFTKIQVTGIYSTLPIFDTLFSGNTYNVSNFYLARDTATSGTGNRYPVTIRIAPSTSFNVSTLFESMGGSNINQLSYPAFTIKSNISGTPAVLNVNSYNQNINNTVFTDINCSGGNTVYGLNLTLSNTTNIQNITLPPTGGGETASVFIS